VSNTPDAVPIAPSEVLSTSPLGPLDRWPVSLRTALDACLGSTFAAFVWWGDELTQLYNQAATPLLRNWCPAPLGRPARETWEHAWPIIGPVVDRVLASGKAAVARGIALVPGGDHTDGMTHLDLYCNAIHGECGVVDGLYVAAIESMECADLATLHERMLDAAVRLSGSDFASLQLLDADGDELLLIAHRGFPPDAAAFWDRVGVESGTTCGKALERHQRVVVSDIEAAPFIRDTIDFRVYRDAGIRAVQTTPLVSRDRRLLGMMSTHWRRAHHPQRIELDRFDLLARQVADVLAGDT
jgi:hypothetical protein